MPGFRFIDLKVKTSSKIASFIPNNTTLEVSEKTVSSLLIWGLEDFKNLDHIPILIQIFWCLPEFNIYFFKFHHL